LLLIANACEQWQLLPGWQSIKPFDDFSTIFPNKFFSFNLQSATYLQAVRFRSPQP
jgi:hypothetical protein